MGTDVRANSNTQVGCLAITEVNSSSRSSTQQILIKLNNISDIVPGAKDIKLSETRFLLSRNLEMSGPEMTTQEVFSWRCQWPIGIAKSAKDRECGERMGRRVGSGREWMGRDGKGREEGKEGGLGWNFDEGESKREERQGGEGRRRSREEPW